jgi:hypothetical protein
MPRIFARFILLLNPGACKRLLNSRDRAAGNALHDARRLLFSRGIARSKRMYLFVSIIIFSIRAAGSEREDKKQINMFLMKNLRAISDFAGVG